MSQVTSEITSKELDEEYDLLEKQVAKQIEGLNSPLFTVNCPPEAIWDAYLSGIDPLRRQHYNCNCCKRFIQKYGILATISEDGTQHSAFWNILAPVFFKDSITNMRLLVEHAQINGVFYSSDKLWGSPLTGGWSHLSGHPTKVFSHPVQSADQMMAVRLEEYKMLSHGLSDYSRETVEQALRVLDADALDRSEKTLGVAKWLNKLHGDIAANPKNKKNLIWLAVATAPPGYAHVRSTMISTLLDDIVNGMTFEAINRRWSEKMHPLQYQRPTAPPKEGNIQQAEKLVEKLGVTNSLLRRFATLDDVLKTEWTPSTPKVKPTDGVFGHLREQKPSNQLNLPTTNITWEKFKRTILPGVSDMEINVPSQGAFYGLVTASDPTAPAIIQWDGLEGHPRNPVSWYFYHSGSTASAWNLRVGWNKVTAVFLSPHRWQEPEKFNHQGINIHFAIENCRDARKNQGLALFPEILKTEMREIRSVIEAHSNAKSFDASNPGDANGLAFQNKSPVTIRVASAGGLASYTIDRID